MSLIVVTGGAGFIGSNIVARLAGRADCDVVVVDWLGQASEGKWRNIAKHPIREIVAPEDMWRFLDNNARMIDGVVHMGAISATTEPDADLINRSNLTLTARLWDWCARGQIPLVYASSAAVYGDGALGFGDDNGFEAVSALRPLNAYGWSKKLADLYCLREASRGHAPPFWAGLRFFNVYGPNEYHKGSMKSVVAHITPKAAAGESVQLFQSHHPDYEDGGQMRDFVHVDDCADIAVWLLESEINAGVVNVGTGKARSFADLAKAVFAALNRKPAIEYKPTPEEIRAKYQYFTQADTTRLRDAGWERPFTELEDGVAAYVRDFLIAEDPYA